MVSLRFTNVALPEIQAEFPWPAPTPENPLTLVMWAYADARDVAEAHVLALDAEIEEYEAFMLAQTSSRFDEPTIDLVRNNFRRPGGDSGRTGGDSQRHQHGQGPAHAELAPPPRLEARTSPIVRRSRPGVSIPRVTTPTTSLSFPDKLRNPLANHQDGDVDVGAHAFGHNGGVHHPQPIRAVDLAVLVHHGHGV